MAKYIMVWDLGTGGNKASLYDEEGTAWQEYLFLMIRFILPMGGTNKTK